MQLLRAALVSLTVVILQLPLTLSAKESRKRDYNRFEYYVLEHDPSHGVPAYECASALGAELLEQVGELKDHWVIRAPRTDLHPRGDRVLERAQDRSTPVPGFQRKLGVHRAIKGISLQRPRQLVKRTPIPSIGQDNDVAEGKRSSARSIAQRLGILDPLFPSQWHLVNEDYSEHMMNVTPVWDLGITGHGVISALVDDGLDYQSEDIKDNFDAAGSYDFNDHEDLPTPKLSDDNHGTRCAGQIAAVKNGVCGLGIAYDSKVAGIRILSGEITDIDEAAALNYGYQNTSIYSCSWGPKDDGESMAAPSFLVRKAMLNGIQNGRGGKGSVFVFASGNGAYAGDQCNFDGYTNSIYSVTVGAIDYTGHHPFYSEPCAANMIVTYSSGSNRQRSIVTTDVGKDKCSTTHGGTSAAAPNAVGVFALALSARPDLSWRDIQHLCVKTARVVNPTDPDWEVTANGRLYSNKFGFGKLDAYDFVTAAKTWELVKPQAWLELPPIQLGGGIMDAEGNMKGGEPITPNGVSSSLVITEELLKDANFEGLEHVTVEVWISHTVRGHVEVELVSPNGLRSILAKKRPKDQHDTGFPGWKFMTVKHWYENPIGTWTIRVSDQRDKYEHGNFLGWRMTLWGSSIDPAKVKPYVLLDTDDIPFPPPLVDLPSPSPSLVVTGHSNAVEPVPTTSVDPSSIAASTSSPVPIVPSDWVSEGASIIHENGWAIGIAGLILLLSAVTGTVYFIHRRTRRIQETEYSIVPNGTSEGSPQDNRGVDTLYDEDEEMASNERLSGMSVYPSVIRSPSGFSRNESAPTQPTVGVHELDRSSLLPIV